MEKEYQLNQRSLNKYIQKNEELINTIKEYDEMN